MVCREHGSFWGKLSVLEFKVSSQPLWIHLGAFTDLLQGGQLSIVKSEETGLWGPEQNSVEWGWHRLTGSELSL